MNKEKNIEQQVDDALNSLDGLQRATPGPYFFTRLQARLHKGKKDGWEKLVSLLSRPAIVAMVIVVILMLDIIAIANLPGDASPTPTDQAKVLADEYNFSIATIYDYEKSR